MKKSAQKIKLLLLDVDGVLTDGSIYLRPDGRELYVFNIYDGLGIKLWREAGFKIGLVTGRGGEALKMRAESLGVDFLFENVSDKLLVCEELLKKENIEFSEVAFMGDDLQDISSMKRSGFALAPNNAREEVKKIADYVSDIEGGRGAVRDCIEFILKEKGIFDEIVRKFLS